MLAINWLRNDALRIGHAPQSPDQHNAPSQPLQAAAAAAAKALKKSRLEGSVSDGDLDLNSGLDGDGSDLLDDLRGGVEVEDALVDAHLEAVPGVGSLSAGRLAGHDLELLGGQAHGAGHLELLLDSSLLQVRAHCGRPQDIKLQQQLRTRWNVRKQVQAGTWCTHSSVTADAGLLQHMRVCRNGSGNFEDAEYAIGTAGIETCPPQAKGSFQHLNKTFYTNSCRQQQQQLSGLAYPSRGS